MTVKDIEIADKSVAAVVIFIEKNTNKVLVHDRSGESTAGETYGFIGGALRKGLNIKETALFKTNQELGYEIKEEELEEFKTYETSVNNVPGTIHVYTAEFPGFENLKKYTEGGNLFLIDLETLKTLNIIPIMHQIIEDLQKQKIHIS